MSSATVAMCGRPWRFYYERKRSGGGRKIGEGEAAGGAWRESGRRPQEESWAAGGAGAGPGCCCAGLFSLPQFLQTEMQEKAKEFGKELG